MPQNPWPRPFTHRFRFTMAKFENAANNIINQLSRTRAGHYSSVPSFQHPNWGEAPKFDVNFSMSNKIKTREPVKQKNIFFVDMAPYNIYKLKCLYIKTYIHKYFKENQTLFTYAAHFPVHK